jgi:outer membrane receptor protein involved in Fe transport
MPASAKQKYWFATEYTVPGFLGLNGNSWVRWSYSWQSKIWKDTESLIDNDRAAYTGPWSTSTLQLGFSHENQWDLSLVVRNLFDKKGISWISGLAADYGTLFGDSRYQRITSIQEPRTVSLSLTKKW